MPDPVSEPAFTASDTALAFEGGGYRGSYTAGMANLLLEKGVSFPFVCGISAGASHAIDFLSRDRWRVKAAFTMLPERIPESGGVRSMLGGHGYYNAEYDYWGCVVDGFIPFDWEAFASNPAEMCIQSLAAETGESVRWYRKDMTDMRALFDRVRASSTVPGFMHPIEIDGHTMVDGGLGVGAGIPVRLAEDAGYERILFVATRVEGYRKRMPTAAEKAIYRALARGREPYFEALVTRNERYNAEMEHVEELERQGRALVIRPDVMPVKSTTIKTPELLRSYEMGCEQALRDWPRVEEYLFG
ncbi:MAG: patatin family protein [Atopobiaceae bacterium]|nr:patatin family protein [Atopobiaceae bacterium]